MMAKKLVESGVCIWVLCVWLPTAATTILHNPSILQKQMYFGRTIKLNYRRDLTLTVWTSYLSPR
jgi:hypothetical protein